MHASGTGMLKCQQWESSQHDFQLVKKFFILVVCFSGFPKWEYKQDLPCVTVRYRTIQVRRGLGRCLVQLPAYITALRFEQVA